MNMEVLGRYFTAIGYLSEMHPAIVSVLPAQADQRLATRSSSPNGKRGLKKVPKVEKGCQEP